MGKDKKRRRNQVVPALNVGVILSALLLLGVLAAVILTDRNPDPSAAATGQPDAPTGTQTSEKASDPVQTSAQENQGTEDTQAATAPEESTSGQTPGSYQGSSGGSASSSISFPYTSTLDELKLVAVYDYSGYYIEDGTEDAIDSVAVLEVTNLSDAAIEYATITLIAEAESLHFTVSLLPAGQTALVMEADRKSCKDSAVFTYGGSEISSLESLDMCQGQVSITTDSSGAVTVTNVSTTDISELRLFYKNRLDTGEYVGGIATP